MEPRIHRAPIAYKTKKKRKFTFKKLLFILCIPVVLYITLFLIVVPVREDKPFFRGDTPQIIAHQAGTSLGPQNTTIAFDKMRSLDINMFKIDIQMTEDDHLVVVQRDALKALTGEERDVSQLTLAELKELDAGYFYRDIRGRFIYRDQGVSILTLDEVFQKYGYMKFIIELLEVDPRNIVKSEEELEEELVEEGADALAEQAALGESLDLENIDLESLDIASNNIEELEEALDKAVMERALWQLIEKYNMHERVLIYSASEKIMNNVKIIAEGKVATAADPQERQKYVLYQKLFINRLYKPRSDSFIFEEDTIFNMKDQRLIDGAHTLNMAVYYSVVNEERDMRDLIRRGVDGIITDRPDLLIRVLQEMEVANETD